MRPCDGFTLAVTRALNCCIPSWSIAAYAKFYLQRLLTKCVLTFRASPCRYSSTSLAPCPSSLLLALCYTSFLICWWASECGYSIYTYMQHITAFLSRLLGQHRPWAVLLVFPRITRKSLITSSELCLFVYFSHCSDTIFTLPSHYEGVKLQHGHCL